jgi:acetolactate synthase-1/2/3 large subunit
MIKTVPIENTAQAYLELLCDRGIKYFFGNAGTDFVSLVDAFARFAAEGKVYPKPILVPHEFVVVSMAHGYYLITGEPQVAMVHTIVGTANAASAIMNAARGRIPILFVAGRTPIMEEGLSGVRNIHIHWAQEAFDQGGTIREFVKWDYELRNFAQLETVVDRALEIAMTEPRGPVYLSLPREVLAEEHREITFSSPSRHIGANGRSPLLYPDPEYIEEAVQLLTKAKKPLILTEALGRNPAAVDALIKLAESLAIPVIETSHTYMNFPTDHPLHLGFLTVTHTPSYLNEADVILVIEADVPWFPSVSKPNDKTKIIHVGIDPLYTRYPIRGYPVDLALSAEPEITLTTLVQELSKSPSVKRSVVSGRFEKLRREHDRLRNKWKKDALAVKNTKPIDFQWLSYCINQIKDDDTIIVNEYDLVPTQVQYKKPGTYFSPPHVSSLGWGLGTALGVKLAAPDKTVIATVGDGSYIFGAPTATHFVSRAQNLPILVIVFNNQCWNAVRWSTAAQHPQGWAVKTRNFPLSDLHPSPAYEKIIEANGGYGERVENPEEVLPALQRALKIVKEEKRQALLNVICGSAFDVFQ